MRLTSRRDSCLKSVLGIGEIGVEVNVKHVGIGGHGARCSLATKSAQELGVFRSTIPHFDIFSCATLSKNFER